MDSTSASVVLKRLIKAVFVDLRSTTLIYRSLSINKGYKYYKN
ncbi:hypothetical protein LEP1GSC008_3134 [Leptospira kirschneri serovar Bulgarica str. Nikolaevo]|uniref:Uncharacterized protein n=1 Tax=Leptospira kirschneri serovar Bulgarica str. Nikolaevo TaxID=1240687 RepID=M6F9B1_9LEPT|nr:hypothetical protein LEP1GSC008_3134 [Leptospira kirschneri serovar Bulgarica str. Nikolaevo]